MIKDLTIRAALKSDAAELAILDDMASSGFASWLWYGGVLAGTAKTALEHGRNLMARPNNILGYESADIAEISGETVGMIISYQMNMPEEPRSMGERVDHVLRGSFKLMMSVHGNWYIDGLAVYQSHHRQGIAKSLLSEAIEKAKDAKVSGISLITESNNKPALALYESAGFTVVDKQPYVPFGKATNIENWLLLSAPL